MKIKTILILIPLMLIFSSCSNLSKNSVKEGEFYIKNGVSGSKKWDENLILKRVSWYHELTLQFDLMIGNITPQSGFNFWFSKSELEDVLKCSDFRILMTYSVDTKLFPYSLLNEQLEIAGFKKIDLFEFKKNLMVHPDSELNSLRLYQVYGVCRKENEPKSLNLNFPGYLEKSIN